MTGKSMSDLKEDMADGAISAQMVAQALESATSAGGMFYGAMEAQSQTLTGQMATLEDNISAFKGTLTEGFATMLSGTALPMVNNWVQEATTAFETDGVDGLLSVVGKIGGEILDGMINSIPDVVGYAVKFIDKIKADFDENQEDIKEKGKEIVGFVIDGAGEIIPDVISIGVDIITAVAGAVLASENQSKLSDAGGKVGDAIVKGIADTISNLGPMLIENALISAINIVNPLVPIKRLMDVAGEAFAAVDFDAGEEWAKKVSDGISNFNEEQINSRVRGMVGGIFGTIDDEIAKHGGISGKFELNLEGVKANAEKEFQKLKENIIENGLKVSRQLVFETENLVKSFDPSTATEEQKQAVIDAMENLGAEVEQAAKEAGRKTSEGVATGIDENSDKPPETVKQLMDRVNDELALGTTDVEGAIAELKDSLKNFAEGSDEWNQIQIKINVLIEQDIVQTFKSIKDKVNDNLVLTGNDINQAIATWQAALNSFAPDSDQYRDALVEIRKLQDKQADEIKKNNEAAARENERIQKEAIAAEKKRQQELEKAYKEAFAERKEAIEDFVFYSDMTTTESIKYQIAEYKKLAEEYANDVEFMKDIKKKLRDLEKQLVKETEAEAKKAAEEARKAAEEAAKAAEKAEEERLKAIKEAYDKEKEAIADRVHFEEISKDEQIKMWEDLLKKYEKGSEQYKEIDRELFDLRKQKAEEDTDLFIDKIDYELSMTQKNETEKLQYKLDAIDKERQKYEEGTEERKILDKQYKDYSEDLTVSLYKDKIKAQQDAYNKDLEIFKNMEELTKEDYDNKVKHLLSLQEKYADNAEILKDIDQQVADYREALLKKAEDLADEYGQKLKDTAKSVFDSFGAFDMLKIDLPEELKKIDEKAEKSIENIKGFTDPQNEYNKSIAKTSELKQKDLDLSAKQVEANQKVKDAWDKWQSLLNQPTHLNNEYTKDQLAAAEKAYNAAVKEQGQIEKERKDNANEIESTDKDTAKNKENITKEIENLVKTYPELKQFIDEETGLWKVSNAELEKHIELYRQAEQEKMKTKKKDDFFEQMDKNIQNGNDYLKLMGTLQTKLEGFGYGSEKTAEKTANALDKIYQQFNQSGVSSLDDLKEYLNFSDEDWQRLIDGTIDLTDISNKTAENQLKGAKDELDNQKKLIEETLKSLPETIKPIADETGKVFMDGTAESIEANAETVTTALNDAVSTAAETAQSTALESGKLIGNNLIDGIIAGIDAMIPQLQAKMSEALSVMTGAATGFLQIASPSKLFKNLVGKNIALGIGAGIDDEMPNVIDDAQKYIKMMTGVIAQSSRLSPTENAMRGINSASIVQTQSAQKQESEEVKFVVEVAGNARDIFSAVGANIEYYRNLDGVKA